MPRTCLACAKWGTQDPGQLAYFSTSELGQLDLGCPVPEKASRAPNLWSHKWLVLNPVGQAEGLLVRGRSTQVWVLKWAVCKR